MKIISWFMIIGGVFFTTNLFSQTNFPYRVHIESVSFQGVPALHSYAYAQHSGKWLILGGRKDGLHARQPFNAFPGSENNTDIYVIDPQNEQVWSASLQSLPLSIREQLQSTNMNFYQDEDTLYFLGGYAYSASQSDHITFPHLTSINVSGLIQAVIQAAPITTFFKQITNQNFAITGGQMAKINDDFLVVGGHRFDGRYNPMGGPSYVQSYTNQIRRFKIDNSGNSIQISDYRVNTDPVHLRRRDYNLIPQIHPGGSFGYTISAGVFQPQADLPFLYPVDVNDTGYVPHTNFNQYLSHYHGAKVAMYDSSSLTNHTIFLGGMSQYYPDASGQLIQDNNVPFVKTISLLSRFSDGRFEEFAFDVEMPLLQGASSEFVVNPNIPQHKSSLVWLHNIPDDTILLGHMYGGIISPSLNPFSMNQTSTTAADPAIFGVYLIKDPKVSLRPIIGTHGFGIRVFPNPAKSFVDVEIQTPEAAEATYQLVDISGKTILSGTISVNPKEVIRLDLPENLPRQILTLNVVFNNKYYTTQKIHVHKKR
jgi:hypothetical protein